MDCIYIAPSQTQWSPKRFTFFTTNSPIHTLAGVSAMQGAIQLIGSNWD